MQEQEKEIIPKAKDLLVPSATLQTVAGIIGAFQELPNPDIVLQKAGRNTVAEYRKLLYDSHVWAVVQSRFAGLNKLEWRILPTSAPARVRKKVESMLQTLDMQEVFWNATKTALFGYSVSEIIWKRVEGFWQVADIHYLPPEWFFVDDMLHWRMRMATNSTGVRLPKYKFIVLQHEATYVNQYGFGVLSTAYWAVAFKRLGIEQWTRFAADFGLPFLLGKAPANADKNFIDSLLNAMESMRRGGALALDERAAIEAVNVGNTAANTLFAQIIDYANAEISKGILSETLTTEIGSTGSYAASQTHADVRRAVTETDARTATTFLQTLVNDFVALNFGAGTEIPTVEIYEQDDVQAERSERDAKLFSLGVRFTEEYFSEYYGLKEGDFTLEYADDTNADDQQQQTATEAVKTNAVAPDDADTPDDTDEQNETPDADLAAQQKEVLSLLFNSAKNRRERNVADGAGTVDAGVDAGVSVAGKIVDVFIDTALAELDKASNFADAEKRFASLLQENNDLLNVLTLARIGGRLAGM